MRSLVGRFASGKKVLNCFSYSGGFSLYALSSNASLVTSVDCNAPALKLAEQNTLLNGHDLNRHQIIQADVFEFLRRPDFDYNLVILDPPAFAKKRGDINAAASGYKEINRLCFERLPPNSFLLTCSCSHFMDEQLFQNIIFQAALEAKRKVQILSTHIQAADHPISLMHPEGRYLKSLFLHVI